MTATATRPVFHLFETGPRPPAVRDDADVARAGTYRGLVSLRRKMRNNGADWYPNPDGSHDVFEFAGELHMLARGDQ